MDDLDSRPVDVAEARSTDSHTPFSWTPAGPLPAAPQAPATTTPRSRQPSRIREAITGRARRNWSPDALDADFLYRSEAFWDFLRKRYFRVTTTGWERLPEGPALLAGVHAGTWLTMDAWMLLTDWWFHFREERILHGTAHDVLMAMPGLGGLFRRCAVLPAWREAVGASLAAGHSVVVWPGGEVDSMRSWKKRGKVVLDGRQGFVRQAIRSGVPIVPVATAGGADTVFVLSEGRWLARALQLKRFLRSDIFPIVAGLPFGVWPELIPSHIPLPSKISNEILEPVDTGNDPEREHDDAFVAQLYLEVEARLQDGVDRLMRERRFPILG